MMEELEALKKKAYDLAFSYEQQFGSCSQCVLAALKETIGSDKIPDSVFLAASGFGAGIAGGGYTCGALAGGVMAMSCFAGRSYDHFSDLECIRANMFPMARELCDRFEAEYGAQGGTCTAVQTKLLGKSFDLYRGYREGFAQSGGHLTACPSACGKAAVWTIEILHEHGRI